jgi:hypothetical protein
MSLPLIQSWLMISSTFWSTTLDSLVIGKYRLRWSVSYFYLYYKADDQDDIENLEEKLWSIDEYVIQAYKLMIVSISQT